MTRRRRRPASTSSGALALLALLPGAGALAGPAEPAPPATPSSPGAPAAAEQELRSSDQRTLGKKVADYFDARRENEKVAEAFDDLRSSIEKAEKKLDAPLLALTEDLGRIFYEAEWANMRGGSGGRVSTTSFDSSFYVDDRNKPLEIEYGLALPKSYNAKNGPYPLVLLIPGERDGVNESPQEHIIEHWQDADLLAGAILAAAPMPESTELWAETGSKTVPGGYGIVLSMFKDVSDNYAVDYDRVFLAGRGPGVAAAVKIASLSPDRFAGVLGRAGDAGTVDPANFGNLPTWFAGGGAEATAFDERVKELGYNNCTLQPEGTDTEAWTWIQAQVRAANPQTVTLYPRAPVPYKAYWLETPRGEATEDARIQASIDTSTNAITIDGTGVRTITVYFNDAMLDLGRPVKIVLNGVEHTNQIPRNLRTLVDQVFLGRCDPGRLFVASMRYDLPEG